MLEEDLSEERTMTRGCKDPLCVQLASPGEAAIMYGIVRRNTVRFSL